MQQPESESVSLKWDTSSGITYSNQSFLRKEINFDEIVSVKFGKKNTNTFL